MGEGRETNKGGKIWSSRGGGEREIGRLTFSCLHISLPESPVWEVSTKLRHKKSTRTRQGMRISFQIPVPMRGGVSLRTIETRPGFMHLKSQQLGWCRRISWVWGQLGLHREIFPKGGGRLWCFRCSQCLTSSAFCSDSFSWASGQRRQTAHLTFNKNHL